MKHEIIDVGNVTRLSLRLSVAETRPAAVVEILQHYAASGNLEIVAERLEVGTNTLKRWIAKLPELAEAIEHLRTVRPWARHKAPRGVSSQGAPTRARKRTSPA